MSWRQMSDQQSLALLRLDEASGTPANIGYGGGAVTLSGTTVETVAGMHFEKSRKFSAGTDVINVANSTYYERMHVGLWCKCTDVVGALAQRIFCNYGSYFVIYIGTSGNINARVRCSDDIYYSIPALDFTPYENEWVHLFMNFDGYAVVLYINGVEVGRNNSIPPGSVLDTHTAYSFHVGNSETPGSLPRVFNGEIAEVSVGPEPRFLHEFKGPYILDADDDPTLGFTVEDSDTLAVYNFDNDVGGTVDDETGNHDGTVVGTVNLVTGAPIGAKGGAKGRDLSGSLGNYISIPHHTDFNLSKAQALSLEIFGKIHTNTNARTLVSKWGSSGASRNGWAIRTSDASSNRRPIAMLGDDDGADTPYVANSPSFFLLDRLFYLAVVFDPMNDYIYIHANGWSTRLNIANINRDWTEAPNTNPVIVGQVLHPSAAEPWDGQVYAIRFTKRAKTLKELGDFYNGSNIRRWV